eukprot:sb/3468509/
MRYISLPSSPFLFPIFRQPGPLYFLFSRVPPATFSPQFPVFSDHPCSPLRCEMFNINCWICYLPPLKERERGNIKCTVVMMDNLSFPIPKIIRFVVIAQTLLSLQTLGLIAVNDRTGVFKTDRNRTGHSKKVLKPDRTGQKPDRTRVGVFMNFRWFDGAKYMKFHILKLMNCLENMSNRLRVNLCTYDFLLSCRHSSITSYLSYPPPPTSPNIADIAIYHTTESILVFWCTKSLIAYISLSKQVAVLLAVDKHSAQH